MHLAFKDAYLAGGPYSRAIAWRTHGIYSHVECWLSGPRNAADCFASREPNGTGYATIDLTEQRKNDQTGRMCNLWTCVEIPTTPEQDFAISWYCEGVGLKRYDYLAILGFVLHRKRTHDSASVMCSELCCQIGQKVLGLWLTDNDDKQIFPWCVSPWALFQMAIRVKNSTIK